jgi:ABC-2 type transport system permease protein
VLVAPVRRSAIVAGKIAGSTVLAVGQAAIVLALAPLIGISLSFGIYAAAVGMLTLIALALSALGFLIAWRMDSTQGFHAVMTAFLMPMWFLSGAFFPATGLPLWLKTIVVLNPLTYGLAGLRRILYWSEPSVVGDVPAFGVSLLVTVVFAVVMIALSARSCTDTREAVAP